MGLFSTFLRCLFIAVLPGLLFGREAADPGQISISVARFLEQGHYTRQKLDEATSEKFLTTYLTALDYSKLYFTQQDIDEFEKKYGGTLGDSVLRGDVQPARDIFSRFKARVEDRIASNKKAIPKDYKFDSDRVVEIKRQDGPWPKDQADADTLWQNRIEAELLKEHLAEVKLHPAGIKVKTPAEIVSRRYDEVLRNVHEMDDEDIVKTFLTSLAQTYDPHSEYFSPDDLDNFKIQMGLSLVGVGAVLTSEDGYAKVKEVVAGGPADKDGHLKVNDRIAGVAQGNEDFEDVVDMKLDKVVQKIRGAKNTTVRLMVIPGDATDPSKRKVVEIVRDEVKLKDSEAKAEMIDLPAAEGRNTRVGWITLPGFYSDMDQGPHKSTTEDVAALIGRLKREGMQGLVIDLRHNGGGSLEEAINLTGLFIPEGPVVQAKDANGKITVSQDLNPGVAYDGPLIVLINRLSASASEIFAAALQDYGRAVIVGDERSFGKGTVQTILPIGQPPPFFNLGGVESEPVKAGALKLTIQKFYRVKGGSTQLKGVESNITLPSGTDNPEYGESSLKNCLTYDEVAPLKITESIAPPLFIQELKMRSTQRVSTDPEFGYIKEDVARLKDMIEKNTLSLNEKERRSELAEEKKRKETRDAQREARGPALKAQDYEVTLDEVAAPKLRSVAFDRVPKGDFSAEDDDSDGKKPAVAHPDPIRNEAIRIMQDYIELDKQPKTASVQTAKTP